VLQPWLLAVLVVAIGGGLLYMKTTGPRPSPAPRRPRDTARARPLIVDLTQTVRKP